jgi:hypothetical protein
MSYHVKHLHYLVNKKTSQIISFVRFSCIYDLNFSYYINGFAAASEEGIGKNSI